MLGLASAVLLSISLIESPRAAGSQTPQANFWPCSPDRGATFASAECGAHPCLRESPHEAGTDDRRRLRAVASGRARVYRGLPAGGRAR